MRAGAALVLSGDASLAVRQGVAEAAGALGGRAPALALVFASRHFFDAAAEVAAALRAELGDVPTVGCVAESVVGGGREVETEPALSLWCAAEIGEVETFAMTFVRTASGGVFSGYRFTPGLHLMICDPFTFPVDDLLAHLNDHAPGAVVAGGMASGGLPRRANRLFLDGRVVEAGAVGVRLGGVLVHTLVSQGCRPVGRPYTVTRAEGNVIYEIGGRPPLQRLNELAAVLPEHERALLDSGLQLGIAIDEYRAELARGDFLVRPVIGAERATGAIAVGEEVEVGRTVQFHVRDAASADEDLRQALERELDALGESRAAAALLFTCNGRGSRLFAERDHDARLVTKLLGDIPLAGFFCAGELGPVGGRNNLHGFTASLAVFADRGPERRSARLEVP